MSITKPAALAQASLMRHIMGKKNMLSQSRWDLSTFD
jgi:hypothetical protein